MVKCKHCGKDIGVIGNTDVQLVYYEAVHCI